MSKENWEKHEKVMNEIIEIWKDHRYFNLGRFISNSLYGNKLEDVSDEELLNGMKIYCGHLKLKEQSQLDYEDEQ